MKKYIFRKRHSVGRVKVSSHRRFNFVNSLGQLRLRVAVLYLRCIGRNITLGGYIDTYRNIWPEILENDTALGERMWVLHRRFCQFIESVTFACCAFYICIA